jgi:protein gp37
MNFWWGCNKVSTECLHCYIAQIMRRSGHVPFDGPMRTKDWSKPRKWNRMAAQLGTRSRVFTCSMSDFFHPGADPWRGKAWDVIRECRNLDWLILTKRPELIIERLPDDWGKTGYPNVWLGVTCGATPSLWRVELLHQIPAAIRFVSAEPLIEPLDFTPYLDGRIHWIITGCERAHREKRRAMDVAWVRDIARQCRQHRVAHFFKQYYVGNRVSEDGFLDGAVRQSYPRNRLRKVFASG